MPHVVSVSSARPPATARSGAARGAFERSHPCPATGKPVGPCPGYGVDHIVPLKHGGNDSPSNMQWQTTTEAKVKDRIEIGRRHWRTRDALRGDIGPARRIERCRPTSEYAVNRPCRRLATSQIPTWTKPHAAGQARSFSRRIGINQRTKGVRPYDATTKANAGGVAASQLC
jgi:hypothetical protein